MLSKSLIGAALLLASMLLSPAAASAPTPALSFAAACSPYDGPSGRLYFLDMSTETGTWDDAKSYCTARYGWGATVAKIDSDAQFSLLREFVTNLQSTGAWIFNKWGQAGADIPGASFLQWCPGEPDNREVEQCAAFTRECPGDVYRAGLISTGCRARQTTMCSRDHSCIDGQFVVERCVGTKRFILHAEQSLSAADAQQFCKDRYGFNARLAEISTAAEWQVVRRLTMAASFNHPWVGLYKTTPFPNGTARFGFADGSEAPALNWCPGEPNNVGDVEGCVVLQGGCMNDVGCGPDKLNVVPGLGLICSVEPGTCGTDPVPSGSHSHPSPPSQGPTHQASEGHHWRAVILAVVASALACLVYSCRHIIYDHFPVVEAAVDAVLAGLSRLLPGRQQQTFGIHLAEAGMKPSGTGSYSAPAFTLSTGVQAPGSAGPYVPLQEPLNGSHI